MKKALVLAGSRGIGKSVADNLEEACFNVVRTNSKQVDTSELLSIEKLLEKNTSVDVLVLNTGGPPAKHYSEITMEDCLKYHMQLFYGFFKIIQEIHINDGGYIFLISSHNIMEPNPNLILSNAYRTAFTTALKSVGKELLKRQISTINIAPGPIKTERLNCLVEDLDKFEETLPMMKAGDPDEIGKFIKMIVVNDIKYISGVTIKFDGGLSNYIF
ncbi:MAG: SDR family oxidoreductase [Candidatus Hodarchaeales archaeon]|jgi:3-oxoacyl-[acyl-carrier protein] reductase